MTPAHPILDRILITNDDGIDAPGLAVLEQVAGQLAREVWVVAPLLDQSGTSHSLSLHAPLRVSSRASGDLRFRARRGIAWLWRWGVCWRATVRT